ncbi:Rex2p KNAG_0L00300 [Huiozyma naganishii CBS 8797]|uniref:Exonuclease domain-containing protein n=1 Tax=Huiozyma naganishii (strain ATCC MYA-139 / BCRC 22969 / CBS 8797 / KCTC 17520 / NBRC 10181 / NCYC 3082 / Yp74L-3) TaxID=1071383 RepID=J7RRZ2_HUIN7|nr:hypothetical protein KNAG_0L00300 [Kazachstania naganishii CBS 8797]CCK72653.1 hypothetical protein KNAG_0L00300 [Kazachstania naganishii CBS 8797]
MFGRFAIQRLCSRVYTPILRRSIMSVAAAAPVTSPKIFKPIVWVDCEMTGLDHNKDHIIEVCCIITDGHLNIVDKEGDNCYESVVHYDKSVMDSMNQWCVEHHGDSGLTKQVLESTKTREQVESELLDYIKQFIPEGNIGVLGGNSVHMDRLFMLREFPKVIDHLFYRNIDVSTIMEVSRRHNPELANVFPKKETAHTAKKDILESIAQLKWYQDHYLKNKNETKQFVAKRAREIEGESNKNDLSSIIKREILKDYKQEISKRELSDKQDDDLPEKKRKQ